MNLYFHPFPAVNLLAGFFLFSLGAFAFFRKRISGVALFSLLVFLAGYIAICYFFEVAVEEPEWKIFFLKLGYFGSATISTVWLLLAARLSGFTNLLRGKYLAILFAVPAVLIVLLWLNGYHGMFWRDIRMIETDGLRYPEADTGYLYLIQEFYTYATYLAGMIILVRYARRTKPPYRNQAIILVAASFIPCVANVFSDLKIFSRGMLNFGPLSFILSGMALWWAIFKYHLFDILPAAKEMLLEHMKAGIIVTDDDGKVVELNSFVERLFGIEASAVIGRHVTALWPELNGEMPVEREYKNSSGEQLFIEIDKTPIAAKRGYAPGYLYLIVNSTEKRKTAVALKKTEEYLYQSQKYEALGRMAGGIAHDFNNILTIIYNYGKVDLSSGGVNRRDVEESFEEIQRAVRRGQILTQQLLAFSKSRIVSEDRVSVGAIISDMREMLGHFTGRDVTLTLREESDPGEIKANRHQVEQMILNIVQNAGEAMPEGGEIVIAWGKTFLFENDLPGIHDVEPGVYSYFSVRDTGRGIGPKIREHIFDPFFTTKETGKGIGLGLSTVYGIVKQQKGHIEVDDREREGTVFRIYIPALES